MLDIHIHIHIYIYTHGNSASKNKTYLAQALAQASRAKELARARGLRKHLAQERAQATRTSNSRRQLAGLGWAGLTQGSHKARARQSAVCPPCCEHVQVCTCVRTQACTHVRCCVSVCVCMCACRITQSAGQHHASNSRKQLAQPLKQHIAQTARASDSRKG